MGAKRFGSALVNPGINTLVMTANANKDSVAVLNIANQGSSTTTINIAYIPGNVVSSITSADYLVYNLTLGSGEFFQLKGVAVEEGHSLVVFSSVTQVSAVAYGMESPSV